MKYFELSDVDTASQDEGSIPMSFDASIVLFARYPRLFKEGDTSMPMEHGMSLLEMALSMPDESEQCAVASLVLTVAYLLNIEELIKAALKLISNDVGIVDKFYADMGPASSNTADHNESIDQLLGLLGIDSSKKKKAMDEIYSILGI